MKLITEEEILKAAYKATGPKTIENIQIYEISKIFFENGAKWAIGQIDGNYKLALILLSKYIEYIKGIEGSDYILIHDERGLSDVEFTADEWNLLKSIADKLNKK